jgi:AraC-type DNA-binding domain-containing proteins
MIYNDFCINSSEAISSKDNKKQLYFMPHPMLRRYISNYTFTYSIATGIRNKDGLEEELTIIPDGSGCLIYGLQNGKIINSCWGPTSKAVKVKKTKDTEDEKMFFIEFLPGGLYALLGVPQIEIKDLQCSIDAIDKSLFNIIENVIKKSKNLAELIYEVDTVLLQIIDSKYRIEACIPSIIEKIKLSKERILVKNIASGVNYSERHINRLFEKNIGMNIKAFERLNRINNVVKAYKNMNFLNSTQIAQKFGFFDQSHLIKDFNEFCGTTPGDFIKNMSDFYNEPFKY